jgi:hypothetical protein
MAGSGLVPKFLLLPRIIAGSIPTTIGLLRKDKFPIDMVLGKWGKAEVGSGKKKKGGRPRGSSPQRFALPSVPYLPDSLRRRRLQAIKPIRVMKH